MRIKPEKGVALAPMTTLELGGEARYFVEAKSDEELLAAVRWAADRMTPLAVLGGGSNVIVPDEGLGGLVVRIGTRGITEVSRADDAVTIEVAAGEPWEEVVRYAVERDLQGVECLAGIPGATGSTPIQNVGAYGQEVAETITAVRALDRQTLDEVVLTPAQCEFAYRDSMFKREPNRYIVLSVTFRLRPGASPAIRYGELQRALEGREPSLAEVRDEVVRLRRKKSMVLDPDDPNRRSAGSFFTNPIVTAEVADEVITRAIEAGIVEGEADVPKWPAEDGRVKLAAGWLIERAGMSKGTRQGNVGLSTAHALALVHHGGGTTDELLAFAEEVRAKVREVFGVELEREPRLLEGVVA